MEYGFIKIKRVYKKPPAIYTLESPTVIISVQDALFSKIFNQ